MAAVTSGGQIRANFGPKFVFDFESLPGDTGVQQGVPNWLQEKEITNREIPQQGAADS